MPTGPATTDSLAISRIIYFTDGDALNTGAGKQDFDVPAGDIPPFIPVNAPGVPGAGICYGGAPSGSQTVTSGGSGYPAGTTTNGMQTRLINNQSTSDATGKFYYGTNLTLNVTANAAGVVTGVAINNAGTGYITGQQVEILGNTPGAKRAVVTIVGASTVNQLVTANKAAQRDQCERLMPFNATEGKSYSEVANGSNVRGLADLTIAVQNPAADGTITAAGANQGRQFWNEGQTLTLECTPVPTPEGTGADANRTIAWLANGAGLTNNTGSAVGGQPLRRTFAVPDTLSATQTDNLVVTCTVTYTDAAGMVATESILIQGT